MKKYIFIIGGTVIFVALLLYFYDVREEVLNREYVDLENDIYIEYPYFNNQAIDSYISQYEKVKAKEKQTKEDKNRIEEVIKAFDYCRNKKYKELYKEDKELER